MPGHHPVPSGVAGHALLRPRRDREQLVEEVCGRLSADLDHDVVALKGLVKGKDPGFWRRAVCPTPSRRSSEAKPRES